MIYARRRLKTSRSASEIDSFLWGNSIGHRRKRLAVAACLLLVVLVILSAIELQAAELAKHIIVIDSGSTGTRVYVYRWDKRDGGMPGVTPLAPTLKEVKEHRRHAGFKRGAYLRIETEPGLDQAAGDPDATRRALQPLLQWAEKTIPAHSHSSSPLFLFGTAGLRRLPEGRRASLLSDLRQLLEASPFRFEPDWVQVIDGVDEGIFGWVGLNFVNGRLMSSLGQQRSPQKSGPEENGTPSQYELDTVGSLDLGGSSLEITFVPSEWPAVTSERVETRALGTPYSVYTHSYKGYGMNDAFDRAITILLEEQANANPDGSELALSDGTTIRHPCIQSGYDSDYSRKDLVWRPRSAVRTGVPPKPDEEAVAETGRSLESISNVRLVGDPNWERCRKLAAKVVDAEAPCGHPPCSLGIQSPPSRGKFFAMSGFYVVYDFFKLPLTATLLELEDAGQEYCSRSWSSIQSEMSDIKNTEAYCFRAPFVSILLQDGLGILPSHVSIVEGGFSWTLGAAISEGVRLAGFGTGGPQLGANGHAQSLEESPHWHISGYTKLGMALVLLVAWIWIAGSAVYQTGVSVFRPWTWGHGPSDANGGRLSPSAGASRSPVGSPMRGPPELRIPVQGATGSSMKVISWPPPLRETAEQQDFVNKQPIASMGRRRPEKSNNCLTQLVGVSD